jgi:hypothetical protein
LFKNKDYGSDHKTTSSKNGSPRNLFMCANDIDGDHDLGAHLKL